MADSTNMCSSNDDVVVDPWISNGGILIIILGIISQFWGFAFICEEYCVPAITVLCKRNKISDDVTGALFIGAGLSLPSLFVSFIGLFVSNTSIGLGTIVGSDIFNHLINLAVSIYVAPNSVLVLDRFVLTRECLFYLASNILLIWSINKEGIRQQVVSSVDLSTWSNCLQITWQSSLILVLCFVVYCVVETFSQRILLFCGGEIMPDSFVGNIVAEAVILDGFSTKHSISTELVKVKNGNMPVIVKGERKATEGTIALGKNIVLKNVEEEEDDDDKYDIKDCENGNINSPSIITLLEGDLEDDHQADEVRSEAESLEGADTGGSMEFVMLKRSIYFFDNRFSCMPTFRQWNEFYATIDENGFSYRLRVDDPSQGAHVRFVNIFEESILSTSDNLAEHNEISIEIGDLHKQFVFKVLDDRVFRSVVRRIQNFILFHENMQNTERTRLKGIAM